MRIYAQLSRNVYRSRVARVLRSSRYGLCARPDWPGYRRDISYRIVPPNLAHDANPTPDNISDILSLRIRRASSTVRPHWRTAWRSSLGKGSFSFGDLAFLVPVRSSRGIRRVSGEVTTSSDLESVCVSLVTEIIHRLGASLSSSCTFRIAALPQ